MVKNKENEKERTRRFNVIDELPTSIEIGKKIFTNTRASTSAAWSH